RGEIALEAHSPTVGRRRVEPVEDALRDLEAALRALKRVGAHVVEGNLDAGTGEHGAHARPHGAGAENRGAPYLRHVGSSVRSGFRFLRRRHTRSGVSGSSVIGTPASARSLTIAAGTAASAPSPQPLAPCGPGPSPFSTTIEWTSRGTSWMRGMRYSRRFAFSRRPSP